MNHYHYHYHKLLFCQIQSKTILLYLLSVLQMQTLALKYTFPHLLQYVVYLLYHFAVLGPQADKSGQTMSGVLVQNQDWPPAQGTDTDLTTVIILRTWLFTATLQDQIPALVSTFQVYLISHCKSSSLHQAHSYVDLYKTASNLKCSICIC